MKKLYSLALATLLALNGAAAQDYSRCYVLTPIGVDQVTLGKKVQELPASLPEVYASLDQVTDGSIFTCKTTSLHPSTSFLPIDYLSTNQYLETRNGQVVSQHEEEQTLWVIDWRAVSANSTDLEKVFVFLEPPSIEYFSGRPLSIVLENGEISALYIYSTRFKTAVHGLSATASLWDLYRADADIILTRSGETILEADGVRFYGINFFMDENSQAVSPEDVEAGWNEMGFGDRDEFRCALKDLYPTLFGEDVGPESSPAMQLSYMSMQASYIVVDRRYRPKGYEQALRSKPSVPMTHLAPGEPTGVVIRGNIEGMGDDIKGTGNGEKGARQAAPTPTYEKWTAVGDTHNPVSPLPTKDAGTYLISQEGAGPVKIGDARGKALQSLKSLFPLIIEDYSDFTEQAMLRCCTGKDYTSEALTFYCGEGSKENQIQLFYVSDKRARTRKGFSMHSSFKDLVQGGGKWVANEGYVVQDGLYFFFSAPPGQKPAPQDTPTIISNVQYLSL